MGLQLKDARWAACYEMHEHAKTTLQAGTITLYSLPPVRVELKTHTRAP